MNPDSTRHRNLLLQLFQTALQAVEGRRVTRRWLEAHPPGTPLALVAIGKAAEQMAAGALEAPSVEAAEGLVITRAGQTTGLLEGRREIRLLEADHPLPGEASLAAGRALLQFLQRQPQERPLLFLISGGASALVEVPEPGIGLELLGRVNRWLLGSGLDIAAMNAVRRRMSAIKGGKLLRWVDDRPAQVLLISDVRGDDPAIIGSGLLCPPREGTLPELPEWLAKALPPPTEVKFTPPPHHLVATLDQALKAAARQAEEIGLQVHLDGRCLEGDARQAGEAFARHLLQAPPGLHLRGGETTVKLPEHPGRGGRNQHLALAAARIIEGRDDLLILAAGTDGSDGNTTDAGALVDGGTIERARLHGFDALRALDRADSGTLLEASGDLVHTGPTGTNVTDLLMGLKLAR